jgi:putative drug exporter of the RND superfamily
LIPLVSVAAVLTLLPALLSSIGPRVDYPRLRHEGTASRGWSAWARLVVRHRIAATAVAVVLLGLLITPVFSIQLGQSGIASLARNGPNYDALHTLVDGGVGTGVLTPIEVLVPTGDAQAAATAARTVDGVQAAIVGTTRHGITVVDVLPAEATVDSTSLVLVDDVRGAVESVVDGDVGVTGVGPSVEDYVNAVYDKLPYVLALISLVTFVLLVRTFRSVLLPLKAVVLNLVSMAAVFGAVVFFWQLGHGSDALFGSSPTGAINLWLPVVIFAFLFGLSMDYEVFILSRMREEYDRTGDTSMAVITGISRTGRLVTSAALILFFAFSALASSPGIDGKILGTAMGVGILIDATIVRALLVPALVSLFGRWNWWLPSWLARALFVQASPLPAAPGTGPAPEPERVPVGVH